MSVVAALSVLITSLYFGSILECDAKDYPKHVLLIGCDGLGGIYLQNATHFLPNFRKLIESGSSTFIARDQDPEISGPNWATLLTGMSVSEHGIDSNDWNPTWDDPNNFSVQHLPPISGKGKIPQTIFHVMKDQDKNTVTASTWSWFWLSWLLQSEDIDYKYFNTNDSAVGEKMSYYIENYSPQMMFLYFGSIDDMGHDYGWGSQKYYDAVKKVDAYIGKVLESLDSAGMSDETLIILTADHGGWRFGHDDFSESNVYIPVIFSGPSVRKNYTIHQYISNQFIAPTILHAFGRASGPWMTGYPVLEPFVSVQEVVN